MHVMLSKLQSERPISRTEALFEPHAGDSLGKTMNSSVQKSQG